MSDSLSQFGTLRSFFWPIRKEEAGKLLPMLLMLFLICFNYTALKNMKDSVVITTSGAEVIPFIKVWVMLPVAILCTYIFAKLSNRYSQESVFYVVVSSFMVVFALFAFVFYPMREQLHLNQFSDRLEGVLPVGLYGLVSMIRYWSFTAFYVASELWSTIVMSVLFWGFANEITKISEARRFYSVLSVVANIATIIAGQLAVCCSYNTTYISWLPYGTSAWEQNLMSQMIMVLISGIGAMAIFWWMNRTVLTGDEFKDLHGNCLRAKKKKRLSMRESFAYLAKSKYILCIAVLVVSYNLVINMVEVVWKDQLRELYPSPGDYNHYMGSLTIITGLVSTVMAFFMPRIIGKLGWTKTALLTPAIMFVTGAGFFAFIYSPGFFADLTVGLTAMSPLAIVVFFGAAQNCFSKAAKYSVFDATKEMAYIPLDHDSKLKGKAAIDGVGSRLGKSGGSLIHQGLLVVFGTIGASTPIVAGLTLLAIGGWVFAVRVLGREFSTLIAKKGEETDPSLTPENETPEKDLAPAKQKQMATV